MNLSGRPDGVPGMVGAIQIPRLREDLIHFHPQIHALVSEGVAPDPVLRVALEQAAGAKSQAWAGAARG